MGRVGNGKGCMGLKKQSYSTYHVGCRRGGPALLVLHPFSFTFNAATIGLAFGRSRLLRVATPWHMPDREWHVWLIHTSCEDNPEGFMYKQCFMPFYI